MSRRSAPRPTEQCWLSRRNLSCSVVPVHGGSSTGSTQLYAPRIMRGPPTVHATHTTQPLPTCNAHGQGTRRGRFLPGDDQVEGGQTYGVPPNKRGQRHLPPKKLVHLNGAARHRLDIGRSPDRPVLHRGSSRQAEIGRACAGGCARMAMRCCPRICTGGKPCEQPPVGTRPP